MEVNPHGTEMAGIPVRLYGPVKLTDMGVVMPVKRNYTNIVTGNLGELAASVVGCDIRQVRWGKVGMS